jgi:hypothetical protein
MKYLVIILICLFAIPAFAHEPIEYGYPVVLLLEPPPEYIPPEPVDTSVPPFVKDLLIPQDPIDAAIDIWIILDILNN